MPTYNGNAATITAYEVHSVPQSFIIDKYGRIAIHHAGLVPKDVFEEDIRRVERLSYVAPEDREGCRNFVGTVFQMWRRGEIRLGVPTRREGDMSQVPNG